MKKVIIAVVAVGLLLLVYVAAVDSDKLPWEKKTVSPPTPTIVTTPTPTEVPRLTFTVNEQVLYDDNGLVIKAMGSKLNDEGNTSIRLEYDNTSGQTFGMDLMAYAVNGIMVPVRVGAGLATPISGGKHSDIYFTPITSYLLQLGETKVRNIEELFFVTEYQPNSSTKTILFKPGPYRISTTDDDGTYTVPNGERIYEKDGVAVEILQIEEGSYDLFFVNETETYIQCTMEAKLNGETAFAHQFENNFIFAGCRGHIRLTLKANDELSFQLYVKPEGYTSGSFRTDTIEYKVK